MINPDCGLCAGTGTITYSYCGHEHGGYACKCPPKCDECGAYGGKPHDHHQKCSRIGETAKPQ